MSAAFLALLLTVVPQSPAGWPTVLTLAPGTAIKVVMKGGDVEGTFVAANADELVIHLKRGDYSIDKPNIRRLDKKLPESNRGRNIDRGAGIGFLAGLIRARIDCDGCSVVGGSIVVVQSVLIGTVVGATASATKWETVYGKR